MLTSFLIVPFVALIITQLIKISILSYKGKFAWKEFDSYGGMPSSHSAFMAAALYKAYEGFGLESPIFAILVFLTFLILRDAVGIRMTIEKHAKTLNSLIKDLPDNLEEKYHHLEPRQGHTYMQVFVGFIIGLLLAIII